MNLPEFTYSYTIVDAITSLAAWDGGAGSGVRDDLLREAVTKYIVSLDEDQYRTLRAIVARSYLTDEAIGQGYGVDDAIEIDWWIEERRGEE